MKQRRLPFMIVAATGVALTQGCIIANPPPLSCEEGGFCEDAGVDAGAAEPEPGDGSELIDGGVSDAGTNAPEDVAG